MSTSTTDDAPPRLSGANVLAIGLGTVAFLLAIIALGRALASPLGANDAATAAESGEAAGPTAVDVALSEFAIAPADIALAGGAVTVTNDGQAPHNFVVEGTELRTADLQPGDTGTVDVSSLSAGTYSFLCDIPGHAAAGMTGTLTISADAVAAPAAAADDHAAAGDHAAADWQAMWAKMEESVKAFPAETEGTGQLVMEPVVDADGVKEFTLTLDEMPWEVEPGKVVDGVGYNGQIPGPTIEVDVGDRVRINIVNELDEITSWHPHGVRNHPHEADGVGFITQDPIKPGETWTAEFTVDTPSVGMYHGHDMGIHQVPNGAVGTFLVGEMPIPAEAEGYEIVDRVTMMLNDSGNIGFSLNGKSFPATSPYVIGTGQAMIVDYMHEGQMEHPMHLHGNRQLVIAKDGFPLDDPYWIDTLNISPGERYTVMVFGDNVGTWVWHCHILNHVEKTDGTMFGMLTALVVTE